MRRFAYRYRDDDHSGTVLDEQQQEELIRKMKDDDRRQNRLYRKVFMGLLASAVLSYLVNGSIYVSKYGWSLSLASLTLTFLDLYTKPVIWCRIPNLAICAGLILYGYGDPEHFYFWTTPPVLLMAIVGADFIMGDVDVDALSGLRYPYKGA